MLAGDEVGASPEELRKAATDTKNGMPEVFGQAAPRRQASTVKFKIVRLEGKFRLLITAPNEDTLRLAQEALNGKLSRPKTWELVK
jgi:hypothetical protein